MATYRNGLTGKTALYIMEPEEELETLRFIAVQKNDLNDWKQLKPNHSLTTQEQAQELNLRGGYGYHIQGMTGGS